MTRMLVLIALLTGCAGMPAQEPTTPEVTVEVPSDNTSHLQVLREKLDKARTQALLIGRLVAVVCEGLGEKSEACHVISNSWNTVTFAMTQLERAMALYDDTHAGIVAVWDAEDALTRSFETMDDNITKARGMVTGGPITTSPRAYAACPGFGDWSASVPQPTTPISSATPHQGASPKPLAPKKTP